MKKMMILLAIVLMLIADLELPGCSEPTETEEPQQAKKVEKASNTKPSRDLESLLEEHLE